MENSPAQFNKELTCQLIMMIASSDGHLPVESIKSLIYGLLITENPERKEFYIEAAKNLDSSED